MKTDAKEAKKPAKKPAEAAETPAPAAGAGLPKRGEAAPALVLPDQDGKVVDLASFAGRKVVVYFYPKDDTPGCTREACDFRDNMAVVSKAGAVVLGVSRDSAAAHRRFREKYGLPFALLTDADGAAHRAWGAWGEKVLYGKRSVGPIRTTVVVDEQGKVQLTWSPVKVAGHAEQVLAALG